MSTRRTKPTLFLLALLLACQILASPPAAGAAGSPEQNLPDAPALAEAAGGSACTGSLPARGAERAPAAPSWDPAGWSSDSSSLQVADLGAAGRAAPWDASVFPAQIATNYDTELGFVPGGTDADTRSFVPERDNFPAMRTDRYAPQTAEITSFVQAVELRGAHINIYNSLSQVIADGTCPNLQMVCNYVHPASGSGPLSTAPGYGCYNLYFSPFFRAEGPGRRNLVIFSGLSWNRSNNQHAFQGRSVVPALTPAQVYYLWSGQTLGCVWVSWNVGGRGSLGLTPVMQADVAHLFRLLRDDYYCDLDRVVFFGLSRGGAVSLFTAQNRFLGVSHDMEWKPAAVFASGAPLSIGDMAFTPPALKPALCGVYTTELGADADRYVHTPWPMYDPPFGMQWVVNTLDPAEANANSADGSPEALARLRGTPLVLAYATQDGFLRLDSFLRLEETLVRLGIDHASLVYVGLGHGYYSHGQRIDDISTLFYDFLIRLSADPGFRPAEWRPPADYGWGVGEAAKSYFYVRNFCDPADSQANSYQTVTRIRLSEPPFALNFPYRLGRKVRREGYVYWREAGAIYLAGASGADWSLTLFDAAEQQVLSRQGTFPLSWSGMGTAAVNWDFDGLPAMTATDRYRLQVRYRGEDVSSRTNQYILQDGRFERLAPRILVQDSQPETAGETSYWVDPAGASLATGIDWFAGIEKIDLNE